MKYLTHVEVPSQIGKLLPPNGIILLQEMVKTQEGKDVCAYKIRWLEIRDGGSTEIRTPHFSVETGEYLGESHFAEED